MLLVPWWRLGRIISVLGHAILLPVCIYVVTSLLIVDLVSFHEQPWFHLMLVGALLAQAVWRFCEIQRKAPDLVML